MPLIEINALPQPPDVDTSAVVEKLNRAVAEALGSRLEAVWTIWRPITGPYAQGATFGDEQPRDAHAPVVHVYLHRTPEETGRVVATIERVLVEELGLTPGNVFITSQPVEIRERDG